MNLPEQSWVNGPQLSRAEEAFQTYYEALTEEETDEKKLEYVAAILKTGNLDDVSEAEYERWLFRDWEASQ